MRRRLRRAARCSARLAALLPVPWRRQLAASRPARRCSQPAARRPRGFKGDDGGWPRAEGGTGKGGEGAGSHTARQPRGPPAGAPQRERAKRRPPRALSPGVLIKGWDGRRPARAVTSRAVTRSDGPLAQCRAGKVRYANVTEASD